MITWIDAIRFERKGGWQTDTQFVLQMGQGYLVAIDKPGTPVEDAATLVDIPRAGKYRVWARCKNWLRGHSPGRFRVSAGGSASSRLLGGLPHEHWAWEIADDFYLGAGSQEIRLVDETGYMARCAALVVTDDFDLTPPHAVEQLHRFRAEALGLDPRVAEGGGYDVIVAGGGPGGFPAALASARLGRRTLLIQSRPVLGGNASSESGVSFDGASARQTHAREGGIAEEIRRLRDRYGCSWTKAMEMLADGQPNLEILFDTLVNGAETEGGAIRSVTAIHARTLLQTRFSARVFIDCTGDGWLGYFAGARYRLGREAGWQHGESLAPPAPDGATMSGCLEGRGTGAFEAFDTGAPIEFEAPEWCYRFPPGREWNRFVAGLGSQWWLEHPGDIDDLFDAEKARDELARIALSYFSWLKHDWDEKERAANYDIRIMPIYAAKRENRRLAGDYVLCERDCAEGRAFHDAVSHFGWTIDVHHPKGVFSGSEGPFHANMHIPMGQLPYRCLYSKNIENLLFAGRDISVTHIALGPVRVQSTIAAAGQAAGTAAALCAELGATPRQIYERHMQELQQLLLREDQFIPGVANADPLDLARSARASASSVHAPEPWQDSQGAPGEWVALDGLRAVMLPRESGEPIQKVWLYMRNGGPEARAVTLHFRKERDPGLFWSKDDIAVSSAAVPPNSEGWIAFGAGVRFDERYLWLYAEPAQGVSWRAMDMAPMDWFRARAQAALPEEGGIAGGGGAGGGAAEGGFRTIDKKGMMIRLKPPCEALADCSPPQAINGYGRITPPDRHMWVSDGLPAELALSWERPQRIARVYVTFDTDMNNPPMTKQPISVHPLCVTDFSLSARAGGQWKTVAEVAGNFQRRARLSFEPIVADAIKLTATKTGGSPNARIIEIRCYAQ
ncbi:MAG: FAD-dependent oxidoreductase [Clostridiales bacterium]|jgi:hypothetical protein|nr:FAD-dependent oxidoreductase [Clostridiales bacterium]